MPITEWDPLKPSLKDDELIGQKRKEIESLLESYTGYFDLFSELIQNALDAVDRRSDYAKGDYKPKIWLKLNLKEGSITVTDNGIGFTEDQFHSFLSPSISYKTTGRDRGNKGVGATYLAYAFNHLEFGTKTSAFTSYAVFQDGRNWVSGSYTQPPKVKVIENPADFLKTVDQGSIFHIKLVGDNIRPKDLMWYKGTSADQWDAILRAKTPLGGVYPNGPNPKTVCEITVIGPEGKPSTTKITDNLTFLYPHLILERTARLKDVKAKQVSLTLKARDRFLDLPGNLRNLNGLYEEWDYAQLKKREEGDLQPALTDEEKKLSEQEEPHIYAFFGYSADIWDDISAIYGLREGAHILESGIQASCDSMPQGTLRVIPLTRSIGYQKMSFVLIHFKKAKPDYGRKGFQPEIEALSESLSKSAISHMIRWRYLLRADDGGTNLIQQSRELNEWIRQQETYAEANPLHIRSENFFSPVHDISLLSIPQQEQDVIVLLNQLIAGGVIRGIRIMATSSSDKYDSLCKILVDDPIEIHKYNENKNPLGLVSPKKQGTSAPLVMEYKIDIDALIRDFEKEIKTESDIKIVVCWRIGRRWKERYNIVPLLLKENIGLRRFHGETHQANLASGSPAFSIICLQELVDYLNDQRSVQDYQRRTYLDLE